MQQNRNRGFPLPQSCVGFPILIDEEAPEGKKGLPKFTMIEMEYEFCVTDYSTNSQTKLNAFQPRLSNCEKPINKMSSKNVLMLRDDQEADIG